MINLTLGQKLGLDRALISSGSVVTIGNYDGVHRGHQQLLNCAVELAERKSLPIICMIFDPHPAEVLGKFAKVELLSTLPEREAMLLSHGVQQVVCIEFSSAFANLTDEEFCQQCFLSFLNMKHLVVGKGFKLGRDRQGDETRLATIGKQYGFSGHYIEPFEFEGKIISSTRIRKLIKDGRIDKANELLGYAYQLSGKVVQGNGLGKKIGFPTANVSWSEEKILPANGVYASKTLVGGRVYLGVTNIGSRPTLTSQGSVTVETHLLDFDRDIYDHEMAVQFFKMLRIEKKFAQIADLKAAIENDVLQARNFFCL